jgi:hypothetical protein
LIFVLFAAKLWTHISYQGAFFCSNFIFLHYRNAAR